jgi:hypothetical protein
VDSKTPARASEFCVRVALVYAEGEVVRFEVLGEEETGHAGADDEDVGFFGHGGLNFGQLVGGDKVVGGNPVVLASSF